MSNCTFAHLYNPTKLRAFLFLATKITDYPVVAYVSQNLHLFIDYQVFVVTVQLKCLRI